MAMCIYKKGCTLMQTNTTATKQKPNQLEAMALCEINESPNKALIPRCSVIRDSERCPKFTVPECGTTWLIWKY